MNATLILQPEEEMKEEQEEDEEEETPGEGGEEVGCYKHKF